MTMGCGTSTMLPLEPILNTDHQFSKQIGVTPKPFSLNSDSGSIRRRTSNGPVEMPKRPTLQARSSIYFTENLFFDREFLPELQINREGYFEQLEWKRPYMIVPQPEMFVAGSTPGDINQGLLGDCWFLSACAAVSLHDCMIARIIPSGQSLKGPTYTGLVKFRFWRFGKWEEVEIDDLLPTINGKLIFAHSIDEHEFWVPLIEKAYAKLHGSYDALEGGRAMDAFVDLTGGFSERYELNQPEIAIYNKMGSIHQTGGMIACSKKGKWQIGSQTVDEFGLVSGHAYTVSDIQTVVHNHGSERLIKVRNPWGDGTEWKGPWSDKDSCWSWVSAEEREKLKVLDEDDGEFWISFDDFCHHFSEVTSCTSGSDISNISMTNGAWVYGISAGGCRNSMEHFSINPQYLIDVRCKTHHRCTLHIALMQIPTDRRTMHQIGFILYESQGNGRLTFNELCRSMEVGKSGVYINHREVNGRLELSGGMYVLIPSTFNTDNESQFLIRLSAQNGMASIRPL